MYTLYIKPGCQFCGRVLKIMEEKGIDAEIKDISDPAVAEELVAHGGKQQTPYLIDTEHGKFMYESDDIINYLVLRISGDANESVDTEVDESIPTEDEENAGEDNGGGE